MNAAKIRDRRSPVPLPEFIVVLSRFTDRPCNIRIFDDESINWLHGIKCLKQSGMPIDVIKMYIDLCLEGESTLAQRYALMMEHKEHAIAKLEEAKLHIAHLEQKTELYQAILEGRSPDTMNPGNWDKIKHMHSDVLYSKGG